MAKLSREELAEIKVRIGRVSFDSAYVKGDPWKGYEVKNENNGIVIAEVSAGYDAEFIANARTDIPALLGMIAELQAEVVKYKIMHSKLIEELKKADVYSEKLEREYLSATLTQVMDDLHKKLRRR